MKPVLIIALLAVCAISSWGFPTPRPREKPLLKCQLRLYPDGKVETLDHGKTYTSYHPGAADIIITNISDRNLDVGSNVGPYAHLDLKVVNPAGLDVITQKFPNSHPVSVNGKHAPYILMPGKSLTRFAGLLMTVPEDELVTGVYKVKAVYNFGREAYESEWVEVKWPGDKK